MGWLAKLFGAKSEAKQGPSEEHKNYVVTATPQARGGQYQTVGEIRSADSSDERVHQFIRADVHPSFEQASQHALSKGKQIIDERGDKLLDS